MRQTKRAPPLLLLLSAATGVLAVFGNCRPALADDAVVTVGDPASLREPPAPDVRRGFAEPSPTAPIAAPPPLASDPAPPSYETPPWQRPREVSALRLALGGAGVTTGRGLGPGLALGLDAGRGSIGFRLSALWFRHEPGGASGDASPLSGALSQYTGELTLDLDHRGPWHPVLGIGFGLAYLARGDSPGSASGYLGVGTGRLALEYALALDDVDVRIGGGVMGVLPGPTDREVQDVHGYAIALAHLAIGF